jgi:hypothetical protein
MTSRTCGSSRPQGDRRGRKKNEALRSEARFFSGHDGSLRRPVSRITESSLVGLAAAATVALNPLAAYSVFVTSNKSAVALASRIYSLGRRRAIATKPGNAKSANHVLHYVPLGSRTVAFAIPVFVLLTFAGIDLVPRSMPGRKAIHGALAAAAIAFAICSPFRSRYFGVDDAFTVERLAKAADENDAVLVYPWASWLVAYYSEWPYTLQRSGDWICNFQPRFTRPNTLVLKPHKDRLSRQLGHLLDDQQFSTVFYTETRENPQLPRNDIFADLERRGYEGKLLVRSRKASLYAFRRTSAME